jgi:uncharacterized protein YnzC (UPF0291/DUF896 family)
MISKEEIARINELARKQKSVGLTEQEAEEQKCLRRKYIDAIKASLRSHLENIEFVDGDGPSPGRKSAGGYLH